MKKLIYSLGLLAVVSWFDLDGAAHAAGPAATNELVIWLDATDMDADGQPDSTPNGDPVSVWVDKTTNHNDATATGSLTYSTNALNGKPAVTFPGNAFFRTVTGGESLHAGFTMIVVFKNNGLGGVNTALEWGAEALGQRRGMLKYNTAGVFGFNGFSADVNGNANAPNVVVPNTSSIGMITKPPGLGDVIRVYLNGVAVAAAPSPLVDYPSFADITIGANNEPNNSEWWNGHIAEVLIYPRALTVQELNETALYLNQKYGVNAAVGDPLILNQPRTQSAFVGDSASFSVTAGGTPPFTYQWYADSNALAGATGTNLTLTNLQLTNEKPYYVVVSNSVGSVTSAVAQLTVSLNIEPITNNLVLWLDAGDMNGDGQPDSTINGATVTAWQDKSGQGNNATATGTLTYDTGGINGRPSVAYPGDAFFRTTTGGGALHGAFTMFAVFRSTDNGGGSDAVNTVIAFGDEASGQRREMIRRPNWFFGFNGFGTDLTSGVRIQPNQAYIGAINKGPSLSSLLTLQFNGAVVGSASLALVDFTSTAITIGANNDPNNSEWLKGDIAEVLVYDGQLSAQELNEVGLYLQFKYGLNTAYTLLGLVLQPQSQTVFVGDDAIIAAQAVGQTPISYQWYLNGNVVSGGTNTTLAVTNAQFANAGKYNVVASNPSGSVTSAVAFLQVTMPVNPVTSNLVLWLDAGDMDGNGQMDSTTNGATVTDWQDKSGQGNNATATGTLTYNTEGINGLPAVNYPGGFFRTPTGGEALHDAYTMFAVFQNNGIGVVNTIIAFGNEVLGQRREMLTINRNFNFNGYSANVNSGFQVAVNRGYIGVISKATSLSDPTKVYVNGAQVAIGTPPLADFSSAAITVGANNGGGERWSGPIAEVLIYSRQLSAQELNQTGLYLQAKYGVIGSIYEAPPLLRISSGAGNVTLSWPAIGTWTLQSVGSLSGAAWISVPGVSNNTITVPATGTNEFFRLRQP